MRNFMLGSVRDVPVTLQFKAEFLNAFNRHIFAIPNESPNSPNFGLVTGTIDTPRAVQFTLRLNF